MVIDTDPAEPPDPVPEIRAETEKPFWNSFTQSDKRLLVMTLLGTLAANVVTVVVVALAVIVTRWASHTNGQHLDAASLLAFYAVTAAEAIWIFAFYFSRARRHGWRIGMVVRVMFGLLGLFAVLGFLVVLGVAAGVT